ncbi:Uncharacterized protein TCM_016770 [Theobroma cacao]|uniref:DUF4283 domain-containing protein n=1 Tax=Theobroma cacao TaxID=3641 RepID=A0A061EIZ7_THECC|nr:Uncharacterized protein TCM_016770 [Theobroma cacao]
MMDQVWIVVQNREMGTVTNGYSQRVEFAQMPAYCDHCCHVGHKEIDCIVLGNKARPYGTTKPPSSKPDGRGKRVGFEEYGDSTMEKRQNTEKRKNPKNGKIMSPEEPTKHHQKWQPVNKGSTSGAKDRQGKEVRSEKASKDENILLLNRFHVISEEKKEEHTRTTNPREEVNKKNYEENEEGDKEGLHRETTEVRWIGAEESDNGKLEGAKLATVPPANLQIMGDSAQGTFHVNGVHGQPQNHMEVRETHAEKENGNPQNCQNNKNLIKSHQKESEGQYTAVQIQKERTQQKSIAGKLGPSLQPANRQRPAKASGQELVEVTAQAGKEGALVPTENRPSTQHSKRDPTNINSAGKGKNSNKATVGDGKLTLDTKQVTTSIQDLNTYPLQHPTQASPAPHGATQLEKETGDQINSDEALEQAMIGQ